MSTGKLKAQYNRVRTSTALHTTSIWSNTIGLQQEQAGTNQAIEAQIYAPGGGGSGGRAAKRQRAQELIEATGYEPSVRDFEGLKALARRQGGDAATNRGACKLCGGLGHLTKQCRNFLDQKTSDGAAAAAAAGGERQLLTADDDEALLLGSDSGSGSGLSDSDSSSSSDGDRRKKRKNEKSKRHKKEKSKKHRKEKSRKHKSSRDRSRDRTGRDRSRSRSPAHRR
eukprot:GHUV01002645.1.p1 GENE.GHUV01002645.1~~GHUV01002645.1.p1  ORF type:complete len:226 (+),score=71.89 GHUV01002645.1:1096-1773(+)